MANSDLTGYCAVYAIDWKADPSGNTKVWKLGTSTLLWDANDPDPSRFALYPNVSSPPNTIDGYTISGIWAYQVQFRFWVEVNYNLWDQIKSYNASSNNGYDQNNFPSWGMVQHTSWDNTFKTDDGNFNSNRCVELICGRFLITEQWRWWVGQDSGNGTTYWDGYRYFGHYVGPPQNAFGGYYDNWIAFRKQRTPDTGVSIYLYKGGGWDWGAVDYNTVIYEQYKDWNGNVLYRATTVWMIINEAADRRVDLTWAPVTGYCAILAIDWRADPSGNTKVWKLGTSTLLWDANRYTQFAYYVDQPPPPNSIDTYTLQGGNFWAYHPQFRFWVEINGLAAPNVRWANVRANVAYDQNGFPPWGMVQHTSWDNTFNTDGGDFNSNRCIECVSGRFGSEDRCSRLDLSSASYWDGGNFHGNYLDIPQNTFGGDFYNTFAAFCIQRTRDQGISVWLYKNWGWGWGALDYNTVIYEQYKDGRGTVWYRATTVWMILNEAVDHSVDPTWAKVTGYCAVLATDWKSDGNGNARVWKLATTTLLWGSNLYNQFAAHTDQGPPPVTLDGYTLQQGNFWAYHPQFQLWAEVFASAWNGIQAANVSANVSYDTTDFPQWGMVNVTSTTDPTRVAEQWQFNQNRCVECICGRFGRSAGEQWRWWIGSSGGNGIIYWDGYRYYNARYTSDSTSAPYTISVNPAFNANGVSCGDWLAFGPQRNNDTGLSIYLYKGGGWDWGAVDFNSVIYEMYSDSNWNNHWRATTVEMLLRGAVYNNATVGYRGYLQWTGRMAIAAQNRDGSTSWRLVTGDNRLVGQPSDYANYLPGYQVPPNNVEGYSVSGDGAQWWFHYKQGVWHALRNNDQEGYSTTSADWAGRASIHGVAVNYNLPYKPSWVPTNRSIILTGQDGGQDNGNDIEVALWRYFDPPLGSSGGNIWVWNYGAWNYLCLAPNQLIYEPLNIGQQTFWAATTAAVLSNKLVYRSQGDQVVQTGNVTLISVDQTGNNFWSHGILSIGSVPSDYTAFFPNRNNGNILAQIPPRNVEGYSIAGGNYWAFHTTALVWFEVDEDSYVRITASANTGNIYYTSLGQQNLPFKQNTLANSPTQYCGGNIEVVWSRQYQQPGRPGGTVIWNYIINSWQNVDGRTLVSEPFMNSGQVIWRPARVNDIFYNRGVPDAQNSTINYNGIVAVITTGQGGAQAWNYGFNSLTGTGLDGIPNFTVAFSNWNPGLIMNQIPPNSVGTYTLPPNWYWVFHMQQLIWYAVNYISYVRILLIQPTIALNYSSSNRLAWLWSQASVIADRNTVPGGDFEIINARAPNRISKPVTMLPFPGQTVGVYTDGNLENVFGNASGLPAFGWQRNQNTGIPIWDYGANMWHAIDQVQVLAEPFWLNGRIMWRPNLALSILQQGVHRNINDPVSYTGNVSLISTQGPISGGQKWITGRSSLSNSGLDKPIYFAVLFQNYDPSNLLTQESPVFWLNGATRWTYHKQQMIWYEIDEESHIRVQLTNITISGAEGYTLTYTSTNPQPSLWTQNTAASDPTRSFGGCLEVFWHRVGQWAALPVETIPHIDQVVGTYTDGNPANVCQGYSSLPAFNFRRSPDFGIQIWLNGWRTIDRDRVIVEPFLLNGQLNWRPNTVEAIRFNLISRPLDAGVCYTGYLGLVSPDSHNNNYWSLSRNGLGAPFANPGNFATTLVNYNPSGDLTVQAPPRSLGSRTLPGNNYWAYNKDTRIWHEVDEESFVRIQEVNTITSIIYLASNIPAWTWSQKSVTLNKNNRPGGDIEVSGSRSPGINPPNLSNVGSILGSSTYLDANVANVFGDVSSLPAFSSPRNPDSGLVVWFYDQNRWAGVDKDFLIAEPVEMNGQIMWRPNTVWRVWVNNGIVDPVIYTGRTAVPINRGDCYIWRLARSNADFGSPRDYANTFSNSDQTQIQLQNPPITIDGYTVQGVWAYHLNQNVWNEIDQASFNFVQIHNNTGSIQYYSSTKPTWTFQNRTIFADGTQTDGNVDLIWGLPNQVVPNLAMAQAPGIDGTTLFSNYQYPGSAFIAEIASGANAVFYVNYCNNNAFQVMNGDQIILEPIRDSNGNITWQTSVVSEIMAKTPVNYTGYAAVLILNNDGTKKWRLGRYGNPAGLGSWQSASFFAAQLNNQDIHGPIEVQLPPNTIENYTISKSNVWAYHFIHKVWYEIDSLSWKIILLKNYVTSIDYLFHVESRNCLTWANRTLSMDPTMTFPGGNIEVGCSRVGQKVIPSVTSLNYPGLGNISTAHPKFGAINPQDILTVWDYDTNGWVALFKNDIVLEPVKLGDTISGLRTTIAGGILEKSYTLTDPVVYTGKAAVLNYNYDGSMSWHIGRLVPFPNWNGYIEKRLPYDFASTLTNYNPNGGLDVQMPPNIVDGYTLGVGNSWAYHISYQIWIEVDQESWERIQIVGQVANINYTAKEESFYKNNTILSGTNAQNTQIFEVAYNRTGQGQPPAAGSTVAFGSKIAFDSYQDPFYGNNPGQGFTVWNLSTNSWNSIFADMIIEVYLPNGQLRFVIAYILAIDMLKYDVNAIIQNLQSGALINIQTALNNAKAVQNDMSNRVQLISSVLDSDSSSQINTAQGWINSAVNDLTSYVNSANSAITNLIQEVDNIVYDASSVPQLVILWQSTLGVQALLNSSLSSSNAKMATITSARQSIVNIYTALINGNLIPVTNIQRNIQQDLNQMSVMIANIKKSLALVNLTVQNAPAEVAKVNGDLDPTFPAKAAAALDMINQDFTTINQSLNQAQTSLIKVQNDYTAAKNDIPSLLQVDLELAQILAVQDNSGAKANEILQQFQVIEGLNQQLTSFTTTTTADIKTNITSAIQSIQGLQNSLTQLNTILSNVNNLLVILTPITSDPVYLAFQRIYNLVNQRIDSVTQFIQIGENALSVAQSNVSTDIASLQLRDTQAQALQCQQMQAANTANGYIQDINNQIAALNQRLAQAMYNWLANAPSLTQGLVTQIQSVLGQVKTYDQQTQAALRAASSSTQSIIAPYAQITSGYVITIQSYINNANVYIAQIKDLYNSLKGSDFTALQNAYTRVEGFYNTINNTLNLANQDLRDAAIQAANAQNPVIPSGNIFTQAFSRVKSFFGG